MKLFIISMAVLLLVSRSRKKHETNKKKPVVQRSHRTGNDAMDNKLY